MAPPLQTASHNMLVDTYEHAAWFDGTSGIQYTGNNALYQDFTVLVRLLRDSTSGNQTVLELNAGGQRVVISTQAGAFDQFQAYVV